MWSDIVKTRCLREYFLHTSICKTAWIYISLTLFDIVKLRASGIAALIHRFDYSIGIALGAAYGVSRLLLIIYPILSWAALLIIWPVLALFQKYDHKIYAQNLMQDYAHSAKLRADLLELKEFA